MKKIAIAGIPVLMAVLLVTPPQSRAGEPAVQPPVPETTQNSIGDDATIGSDEIFTVEPAEQPVKQPPVSETTQNGTRSGATVRPDEILIVEPSEQPAKQPIVPEAAQNSTGDSAPIRPGERLTVERCVQIALRNNPYISRATYQVNTAREVVGQYWSYYYPEIKVTGGYIASAQRDTRPTSTIPPVRQESYNWTASVRQTITDFGRTEALVSDFQRQLDASREELRDTTGGIVYLVKKAYYTLVQKEKNRDVLKETVALFDNQLEEARRFYEAGVKSRFDVTSAEVNLSTWKMSLIGAENDLRVARVSLNNAMGLPDAPEYGVEDILPLQKYAITFEEARDSAFLNRPDIHARAAEREAAEQYLSYRRKGYFPTLSGNASYTRYGDLYPHDESNWNVQVTLEVPLFSGFLTNHQVGEAKEKLNDARAYEEVYRQAALLDMQQAYLNLQGAEERVGIAELTVKQAEENYTLAHGRYKAGSGQLFEETEAISKLSSARSSYIAALTDYKTTEAELRKAIGE